MPSTGRLLQFPRHSVREAMAPDQAMIAARSYFELQIEERGPECRDRVLSNPDVLMAVCLLLRDHAEVSPADVAKEAGQLYAAISKTSHFPGLFDEKQYFLGETALLMGRALRHLGKREEAELWLDRADAGFRLTVNSGPVLANVAYARLALRYDWHRYQDVIELLPSLVQTFETLRMDHEAAKCRYLEAVCWKQLGERTKSVEVLEQLRAARSTAEQPALMGQTLVDLGEYHATEGRYDAAMTFYREALECLARGNRPISVAHLKWSVAETLRAKGDLGQAVEAFRGSQRDFQELGVATYAARVRLETAESLLALGRPREAEWELLAALPTIEEQQMAPEGFAAVALLKESVRQRKTDPNALRELREHLQAANQK